MRFDIERIAKQVANRIAGKLDGNQQYMEYREQVEAVHDELEWMLGYGVPERIYHDMLYLVTEHPEVQFVFEVAEKSRIYLVNSWEKENKRLHQDFMRDAL